MLGQRVPEENLMARCTDRDDQAALFRKAAQEVAKGTDFPLDHDVCVCMCDAIYRAAEFIEIVYKPAFELLWNYIGVDASGPDAYRWGKNFGETPDEIRKCREVALLFMAAMVEAGDA